MEALKRLIPKQLSPIPGVEEIRLSFALKQVRWVSRRSIWRQVHR